MASTISDELVLNAVTVARDGADRAEANRRLPPETVDALAAAGLLSMCLPVDLGGPGVGPLETIELIERVAHADGAAGWCSMISSTTSSMAVFLEPDIARSVFALARATGGGFAPNGVGRVEGDDVVVSGRWQWGSGTQHCDWVVGGARCDDGIQRTCIFPASEIEFHDTWFTSGMRGSGSLDFSVDEVRVPLERTVAPGRQAPRLEDPIARFPNFTLLAIGVAAVGLGVARRALDELVAIAGAKTPQFSSRTLAESGFAQGELARAEASWRAARAHLHTSVGEAWDEALAGRPIDVDRRVGMRLAAMHAASEATSVTDRAFTVAGGSAVYDTSVLGRCLRDAHVVPQHIMVAPRLAETLGKHLMGVDLDASMI
ncbi:MAG: acyl-CoA dehydrogenase family protein [Ilumatobacteraceae bacterium]